MHVTSMFWPDIKSQIILEYRFRLKWTKRSLRTNPNAVKTRQTPAFRQEEAQDSLPEEDGGGWPTWQADRPTRSADLACGPHRLNFATCCLLTGCSRRFCKLHPVAPCYKYKGGWRIGHTHTTLTSPLLFTSCIVCRLSGDYEKSRSLRVSGSAREFWYGFISSSLL